MTLYVSIKKNRQGCGLFLRWIELYQKRQLLTAEESNVEHPNAASLFIASNVHKAEELQTHTHIQTQTSRPRRGVTPFSGDAAP